MYMYNMYVEIGKVTKNATEAGHNRKTLWKIIFDCNGGGWLENQNTQVEN